jgi:hypothetical protein
MNARISAGPFRNGWRVPDPDSGIAGQHILMRAAVQATQMGIFPLEEAIYLFAYRDRDDALLHGSHRYTLTFGAGELPPLREFGFWSLTIYNDTVAARRQSDQSLRAAPQLARSHLCARRQLDLVLAARTADRCARRQLAARTRWRLQRGAAHLSAASSHRAAVTWFPPAIVRVA